VEILNALVSPDMAALVSLAAVGALFFLFMFGALWLRQLAKTEAGRQFSAKLSLLDDYLFSFVELAASKEDLAYYEELNEEVILAGGHSIDPRMRYVLEQAERFVERQLGLDLEFEEIYARAQAMYRLWKQDNTPT
jgi:hypothetical protein